MKTVVMYDKHSGKTLKIFDSVISAGLWLYLNDYVHNEKTGANGVSKNCLGYTKSAYGFCFEYVDKERKAA